MEAICDAIDAEFQGDPAQQRRGDGGWLPCKIVCWPGHVHDYRGRRGNAAVCLFGDLQPGFADGRRCTDNAGVSDQAAVDTEPHRLLSRRSQTLFIID
jgi:hypothetical protein